jgi:molecular chaperone DnaK
MNTIAIDFGTTRTKAARFDAERGRPELIELGETIRTILPSVFYIPPGDAPLLVGDRALDHLDEDPRGIVRGVKRRIHQDQKIRSNKRAFAPVELAAALFEHVRCFCETSVFHGEVRSCVLTVPVAFDSLQRERIIESARRGGFGEVEVIDESVAAARHWLAAAKADAPPHIVVCDIGGGTTDLALLRRTPEGFAAVADVPPSGFQKGGNDIDENIFDELLSDEDDQSPLLRVEGFRVRVQRAKERFSRDAQRQNLSLVFDERKIDLTRSQVEACSSRFIDDVVAELRRFRQRMNDAALGPVPLLLVGGGSCILGLEERFSECWNAPVLQWSDSEYATVLGAVQPAKLVSSCAVLPTKKGTRPSKPYDPNAILW